MKVPLSWLKEYISLPSSLDALCETLTLAGLEVEGIEEITPKFSGVVVAKVLQVSPHPNADRLQVAQVFDGNKTVQVVCGDPNCRAGITVAFASVGSLLPTKEQTLWSLEETTIRKVPSFGMICALEELGLAETSDHILELSDSLPAGKDVASIFQDTILDLSLTPNLGHCMSIYGIARELSSFLQSPLLPLNFHLQESSALAMPKDVSIVIENQDLCPSYHSRLVHSIQVGPSPFWLARRLELSGIRSVNNVVDISNYVLQLTGQPLHFFDFDQIEDRTLFVKTFNDPQVVQTLDGEKRTVPANTLLICDSKNPLAIAGVIGAQNGSIQETTTNVLIEAALFCPSHIRKSSKALGCKTSASMHFERGIDPLMTPLALDLAADLLRQYAGGSVAQGSLCVEKKLFKPKEIPCSCKRINSLLGTQLSFGEIQDLLERLHMKVKKDKNDILLVSPPSYRNDISQEVDLTEEVARLYGFHNLPKQPAVYSSSPLTDSPLFIAENHARTTLLQEGLQEFLTCDLISPVLSSFEEGASSLEKLHVLHSKSSDYSILRTSLFPGLMHIVKHNLDHENHNLSGFEVGRVHYKEDHIHHEPSRIGIVLTGLLEPYHFSPKTREVDFYDLKGIVENLLSSFSIEKIHFTPAHMDSLQPGRQAHVWQGSTFLGFLGEVHPSVRSKLDISQRVYFAELDLCEIAHLQPKRMTSKDLPTTPGSDRDWTLTLPLHEPVGPLLSMIRELASPLLESVSVLDCFTGDRLGSDRKNLTLHFFYRDKEKTLDFATIEEEHAKLLQKVAEKLGNCLLW